MQQIIKMPENEMFWDTEYQTRKKCIVGNGILKINLTLGAKNFSII